MKSASLSILSFILDFVQILADLSVCAFLLLLTWSPAPSEQSPAAGNHSGRGFRRAAKKAQFEKYAIMLYEGTEKFI